MSSYVTRETPGNTEWFTHDRFGMFIHWGLFSLPARIEWVQTYEQIAPEEYVKFANYFDPDLYNPEEWAKQAAAAGMKYVVLTTKHHEGFCMFDSKYTDFKATNTPAKRDLVREFVDAFRAQGIRIGFYYSLIDWHHPDFVIDFYHPLREHPQAEEMNKTRNMHRYAEYMRNQLTELMTNYGKIDILWLDFSYTDGKGKKEPPFQYQPWMKGKGKDDWESEELIKTVRALQPEIIIDNRADLDQDVWTPEQIQVTDWVRHPETGERVTWETCQTVSSCWGHRRDAISWKAPDMLIKMLIETVSCGGNLLMNIGPTARGCIDAPSEKALAVYAEWMKYHSRSIYGCTMAEPEFTAPNGCKLTQSSDGKRLYIHLFSYPFRSLQMHSLSGKVEYAQFLHDGSQIKFEEDTGFMEVKLKNIFWLPDDKPDVIVPVIEVFLKA